MPEHFRRAQSREEQRVPPLPGQTFDFVTLTEQEEVILQAVLQKEDLERRIIDTKICELRKEIQEIRKAGALTADDNQNAICARCKFKFSPVLLPWADHGRRCVTCKFKVCGRCCTKQFSGTWLCILCFKYRQEKLLTGEWMSRGQSAGIHGSQLLKALLKDNQLQKEKSRTLKTSSNKSMTSSQDYNTAEMSVSDAASHSRFYIKPSSVRRSDVDMAIIEHRGSSGSSESSSRLCMASTSFTTGTGDPDDINSPLSMDTSQLSKVRNRGSVQKSLGTGSRGSHKRHKVHTENACDNFYTFDLPVLPATGLYPEYSWRNSNLNRRKSISEQTLYKDDMKKVVQNLTRMSSHQGRSNSALSSEFGNNPKYSFVKAATETSELEMFRKRGERYSLRRRKSPENETKEDKIVNTGAENSVTSTEKQMPIKTTDSEICQRPDNLCSKSPRQTLTIQDKCRPKSASFPSLSVIQSDCNPFSGLSQRKTEIPKDPNSLVLKISWDESSSPSDPTPVLDKTVMEIRKRYKTIRTYKCKSSSAPDLFSSDTVFMLPNQTSNAAEVLIPNPYLNELYPESSKEDSCCSTPSMPKLVDVTVSNFQISPVHRPNHLDLSGSKFQISPADTPKHVDLSDSKFQISPLGSPKHVDSSRSKFQISPSGSPKHLDLLSSKFQISPSGSPKHVDSSRSKFQISPSGSPKHLDLLSSKFQISPSGSPKHLDLLSSKFQIAPVSTSKHLESPVSRFRQSQMSTLRHSISSPEVESHRHPGQSKVLRSRSDASSTPIRWQTLRRSWCHGNKRRSLSQFPESTKDTDSGITSGSTTRTNTPEQRGPYRSNSNQSSVPSISVTNIRGESFKEEDDDLDELFNNRHSNQFLGSRSSLADSRESIYSCYSDAGEVNYGRIPVTGEIMFSIDYEPKAGMLKVHVKQCRDLAPVDTKHNRSDPYVKTYLLPDKTRGSKRKTRIKKHTLNPVFDEVLKYQINSAELESRTLWLTVWHNDRLGRNDFLGEVTIPLDYYRFDQNTPTWYPLQERAVTQEPVMFYKGDLLIALKYIPADMVEATPKKKPSSFRRKNKEKEKPDPTFGEVHVLVREAQNLTAMRASAGSNPFCKGYLLPDTSHTSKQKTPVVRKTTNPQWQHILVFGGIVQSELHDYCLELTIWDHEKLSSNDFLGGVRLNLGYGTHQGKPVDWMDATGDEIEAWQAMIDHPNEWVDAQLPLRASMGKQNVKK